MSGLFQFWAVLARLVEFVRYCDPARYVSFVWVWFVCASLRSACFRFASTQTGSPSVFIRGSGFNRFSDEFDEDGAVFLYDFIDVCS